MSRSTDSSNYRNRLRTLYNRRPSGTSTKSSSQRRRSQIVNRDLDDRFSKRLNSSLGRNNTGKRTALRKLGGSRARYRLPGSRNSGSKSSSSLRTSNRSSTRVAIGVDSLRSLRSTRAPASVSRLPRSRTSGLRDPGRYDRHTLAGADHHFHGGYHSSGHISSISFGFGFGSHFGTWGLYAYPYHYSHYLPYSYYAGYASLGIYWNSHYPHYYGPWWWPRYAYAPGRWSGYYGESYYAPTYYSPSYGSTVVYGVDADKASEETAVDEGSEQARLARLAQQHLDLGDFYFQQGRYQEAAESYMRALAYAPDDGAIHFVIADSLFAQGDYHYAAFMISKGLELEPGLAFADADKRNAYEDPANFERQMETLHSYLVEKPFDAAVHMVLGYNLMFSGDRSAATPALKRALEIDPGNRAAKVLLDARDGMAKPGKTPEAEKAARKPVKKDR